MREIDITVDSQRHASAPRGAGILCNNSDQRINFNISADAGFDLTAPMTAVFVTCRGALPPIEFSDGYVMAPVLTYNDGQLVYVGLTQGDIKTSWPAKLDIFTSIYSIAHGHEAEPDPGDSSLPIVAEVTLDDLVRISDVEHGRQVLITLQTLQETIGGGSASDGHSPYIGDNGNWYEWDSDEEDYVDTGVQAEGQDGADGQNGADGYSPTATVTKSGSTITISITDKNGTTSQSITDIEDAIRYGAQVLTAAQKAQARENIGAGTDSAFEVDWTYSETLGVGVWTMQTAYADWAAARDAGDRLSLKATTLDAVTVYDSYDTIVVNGLQFALFTRVRPTATGGNIDGARIMYFAFADDAQNYRTVYTGTLTLARLDSPAFTGTPTAPTAPSGTNSTQIATTAFVQNEIPAVPSASSATPNMDSGAGSAGSSTDFARADHTHPTDTSRAAASDLAAKITAPQNPLTGDFLCWDGTAWAATTLANWQGGNY